MSNSGGVTAGGVVRLGGSGFSFSPSFSPSPSLRFGFGGVVVVVGRGFLGKLTIAVAGALLGGFAVDLFSSYISQEAMIVISIVLTVVITVILLKVDLNETTMKILHKKPKEEDEQKKPNISPDKAVQED